MNSAIVIGAGSMLGTSLTSRLSADGVRVITAGRSPDADIQLDLATGFFSPVPPDTRADVIFHCAASFADDSQEGIRENYRVNAAGCLWVLELAELAGCKTIIYAGSIFSSATLDHGNYTSYGFSKAQAENLLTWGMDRANGQFCSLRFSQIYDTDGACIHHQPLLGRIIPYAARGLDLNMPASSGLRNFLHLDDAVALMLAAVASRAVGILDIVHPESLEYGEIARKSYAIFSKGGEISIDPGKTPFRPLNFPDGADAFRLLGRKPEIPIDEGIRRIRDQETWSAFGPLDVA